jgi:hypothetical protein
MLSSPPLSPFVQDVSDLDRAERNREFQNKGEWLGEVEMREEEVRRHRRRCDDSFACFTSPLHLCNANAATDGPGGRRAVPGAVGC